MVEGQMWDPGTAGVSCSRHSLTRRQLLLFGRGGSGGGGAVFIFADWETYCRQGLNAVNEQGGKSRQ